MGWEIIVLNLVTSLLVVLSDGVCWRRLLVVFAAADDSALVGVIILTLTPVVAYRTGQYEHLAVDRFYRT